MSSESVANRLRAASSVSAPCSAMFCMSAAPGIVPSGSSWMPWKMGKSSLCSCRMLLVSSRMSGGLGRVRSTSKIIVKTSLKASMTCEGDGSAFSDEAMTISCST